MKNLSARFLPLLAAMLMLLFFAACEKDEVVISNTTPIIPETTTVVTSPVSGRLAASGTQPQSSSSTGGLEIGCISVDYPFDFQIDGVSFTINSAADLDSVFTINFTANTVSADFVYPLNITLEDGTAAVAADGTELAAYFSSCVPTTGWGNGGFPAFYFDDPACISLNYPVDLVDLDGNTVTAADPTEFSNLIASNQALSFVFPISVVDTTGSIVSVADDQALFDILAQCACPGNGGHGGTGGNGVNPANLSFLLGDSCFTHNYPINILDINGNVVSVADESAFSALVLNGDFIDFEYPLTVTLTDGTIATVNDGNEFSMIIFNCAGGTVTTGLPASLFMVLALDPGVTCYSMVYPFDVMNMDGSTTTVTSEMEAMDYLQSMNDGLIEFPIDVIETSSGATLTFTSEVEFFDLLNTCQ